MSERGLEVDRHCNWKRLEKSAERRKIAFVLGAGTSRRNEIPVWSELINTMAGDKAKDFDGSGLSPEAKLELFKLEHSKNWISHLRRSLYEGFERQARAARVKVQDFRDKEKFYQTGSKFRRRAFELFSNTNPTLVNLVQACSIPRGDGGFIENSRIGAVLTTNIDALVQLCDRACHGSRILRTLERAHKRAHRHKLPLYQLHGYLLPWNARPSEEACDRLVFTESEYLERNDNPHCWANVVLHWALREFVVVFVGCSMSDPLIRRALYRTRLERIRDLAASGDEEEVTRHYSVCLLSKKGADAIVGASLSQLGIWPLWVRDYEKDLPARTARLGCVFRELAEQDEADE